jgi:large subunit ribosomal protein L9
MVDVILLERAESLGHMGQVVKVKPGYARNFLRPQKKALRATKDNLKYFESQRAQLEANNLRLRAEAEQVATKMAGLSVIMLRQAGETGQLYGSVSADRAGSRDQDPGPAQRQAGSAPGSLAAGHGQYRAVRR